MYIKITSEMAKIAKNIQQEWEGADYEKRHTIWAKNNQPCEKILFLDEIVEDEEIDGDDIIFAIENYKGAHLPKLLEWASTYSGEYSTHIRCEIIHDYPEYMDVYLANNESDLHVLAEIAWLGTNSQRDSAIELFVKHRGEDWIYRYEARDFMKKAVEKGTAKQRKTLYKLIEFEDMSDSMTITLLRIFARFGGKPFHKLLKNHPEYSVRKEVIVNCDSKILDEYIQQKDTNLFMALASSRHLNEAQVLAMLPDADNNVLTELCWHYPSVVLADYIINNLDVSDNDVSISITQLCARGNDDIRLKFINHPYVHVVESILFNGGTAIAEALLEHSSPSIRMKARKRLRVDE